MKRLLAAIAILAVIMGTAAAAAPAFLSARHLSGEIADRIGALTGGTVEVRGEPEVSAFPSITVKVEDIVVADKDGSSASPGITVPELHASLKLLPLLTGRIEMGRLTMIEPRFSFDASHDESKLRTALVPGGAEEPKPQLGEIAMRDATIVYRNGKATDARKITFAEFRIAREKASQAIAFSGRSEWCANTVTIEGELENPRAAFAGSGSPARLSVTLEPSLERIPDGEESGLSEQPASIAKGSGAPTMRSLAGWLDVAGIGNFFFGPLTMQGKLEIDESSLLLSDADLEFAGNRWEGRLALGERGTRPLADRLFSLGEVDLCSYAGSLYAADFEKLRAKQVNAEWLADADLNFEIASDRAVFDGIAFTDVAARLAAHEGEATLGLEAADSFGGQIEIGAAIEQARLSEGPGVALDLSGRLADIRVNEIGRAVWSKLAHPLVGTAKPPEGTASSTFDLKAEGSSLDSIVSGLTGWAVAEVRDGTIDGADIVLTLEKLAEGSSMIVEGEGPFIPVAGRTSFTKLSSVIDIGSGVANVMQSRIAGERFEIVFSGRSDLKRGELDATGTAFLFEDSSNDRQERQIVELPFGVGGTLRDPVVAPGVPRIGDRARDSGGPEQSLIRLVQSHASR